MMFPTDVPDEGPASERWRSLNVAINTLLENTAGGVSSGVRRRPHHGWYRHRPCPAGGGRGGNAWCRPGGGRTSGSSRFGEDEHVSVDLGDIRGPCRDGDRRASAVGPKGSDRRRDAAHGPTA